MGQGGPRAGLAAMKERGGDEFKGFYPFHHANLLEALGDDASARAAYQLSTAAFGGSIEYLAYGSFLERQGDLDEAREFYQVIRGERGGVSEAAKRALVRIDRGASPASFRQYTPQEGAAIAFYSLGRAILQQSENQRIAAQRAGFRLPLSGYNLPLAMVRTALYLDPDFDEARHLAGRVLSLYENHEAAIDEFDQIKKKSPYYPEARANVATNLAALERDDAAIETLEAAIKLARDPRDLQFSLASLLATRDRFDEAVAVMDQLIAELPEETPRAWQYYIVRGDAQLQQDNWPAALADLKKAYDLAPEEPTTLNYLGYSWAERGENLDEAFALIEQAIALNPSSGAIIDSLGWAHFQLGNHQEAVGHLEQAASLEPSDPTITDHLGDVYWRLGRMVEAGYQWQRVLELEPGDELAKTVRDKLKNGLSVDLPEPRLKPKRTPQPALDTGQ